MKKMIKEFKNWKEDVARRKEYLAMSIGAASMLLIVIIIIVIHNTFNTALLTAISAILLGKLLATASKFILFLLDDRKSKKEAK